MEILRASNQVSNFGDSEHDTAIFSFYCALMAKLFLETFRKYFLTTFYDVRSTSRSISVESTNLDPQNVKSVAVLKFEIQDPNKPEHRLKLESSNSEL